MTQCKKLHLKATVIIILTLSVWFIMLDLSRFVHMNFTYDIYPSAVLKRINVILAASIAWSVGKEGLSQRDSRLMKAAFVFVLLGEVSFAAGERLIGVCLFALCQSLLIIRNSTCLRRKLFHANYKQRKRTYMSGFIIVIIIGTFFVLIEGLMESDHRLSIICIYVILLSISLWAGLTCSILGLLPEKNSRLVALGMLCFYCCDILVGLDALLDMSLPWLLANSFIWVFYIPALTMLALSCYRYE